MRKAAKTLIAGTLIALPLQALWCGAATSQTAPAPPPEAIVLKQVDLSDVMSGVKLNVVTQEVVTGVNSAIGNAYTGGADGVPLQEDVKQVVKADVRATTQMNVASGGYAGTTVLHTAAYGNTSETTVTGGANLTGGSTQAVTAGRRIGARTNINAYGASLGPLTSVETDAVANTRGIGIEGGGTASTVVDQTSGARVQATNSATFGYTAGEADFSAVATSNNITATGTTGSSQIMTSNQVANGKTVALGEVFTGNAQTINNATTAAGNNLSASNDGGPLDMAAHQANNGAVIARTTNVAYEYGTNNGMAYGVGNAISAGETGIELSMDFDQANRGRIDVSSDVSGTVGYDSSSSSVAMGNQATGFVCSSCGGTLEINGRQTNSASVTSSAVSGTATSGRSMSAISTAVGNSATFYASRPGN